MNDHSALRLPRSRFIHNVHITHTKIVSHTFTLHTCLHVRLKVYRCGYKKINEPRVQHTHVCRLCSRAVMQAARGQCVTRRSRLSGRKQSQIVRQHDPDAKIMVHARHQRSQANVSQLLTYWAAITHHYQSIIQ